MHQFSCEENFSSHLHLIGINLTNKKIIEKSRKIVCGKNSANNFIFVAHKRINWLLHNNKNYILLYHIYLYIQSFSSDVAHFLSNKFFFSEKEKDSFFSPFYGSARSILRLCYIVIVKRIYFYPWLCSFWLCEGFSAWNWNVCGNLLIGFWLKAFRVFEGILESLFENFQRWKDFEGFQAFKKFNIQMIVEKSW